MIWYSKTIPKLSGRGLLFPWTYITNFFFFFRKPNFINKFSSWSVQGRQQGHKVPVCLTSFPTQHPLQPQNSYKANTWSIADKTGVCELSGRTIQDWKWAWLHKRFFKNLMKKEIWKLSYSHRCQKWTSLTDFRFISSMTVPFIIQFCFPCNFRDRVCFAGNWIRFVGAF